jgi:hypothetical protein
MKSFYDRILPRPYLFINNFKARCHTRVVTSILKKHTSAPIFHTTLRHWRQFRSSQTQFVLSQPVLNLNYSTTLPSTPNSQNSYLSLVLQTKFYKTYSSHVPFDLHHHITSIIAYRMAIISSHNAILWTPSFRLTWVSLVPAECENSSLHRSFTRTGFCVTHKSGLQMCGNMECSS